MIAVQLTRAFEVQGDGDLELHVERLMESLLALESSSIRDSDVSASLSARRVEVSVYAIGATFDEAAEAGDAAIRSAIHAADGHTPNWVPIRTLIDTAELAPA